MGQYKKIVLEKYFVKISARDRERVKLWLKGQKGNTRRERKFLKLVKKAIKKIDYEYWIASIEPSYEKGRILYEPDYVVATNISCEEWKLVAEEYAPERGSRLATIYELLLWYALRIEKGFWTLNYVAYDSSYDGNYWYSHSSSQWMDRVAAKKCGGYYDGQGNTYKIVMHKKDFVQVGGCFSDFGDKYPVASTKYLSKVKDRKEECSCGVLVLTKA